MKDFAAHLSFLQKMKALPALLLWLLVQLPSQNLIAGRNIIGEPVSKYHMTELLAAEVKNNKLTLFLIKGFIFHKSAH